LSISKSEIVDLQMEMIRRFGEKTMQRGWLAYQKGCVLDVQVQPGKVRAEVRVKQETYRVHMDLQQFDNSRCSCSTKRYCYHMAAVFFSLYGQFEKRTELFLMQHQQMRLRKSKEKSDKQKRAVRTAAEPAEATVRESHAVQETDALHAWQLDLNKKFAGYFTSPSHHVEAFHVEAEKYVLRISEVWRPEMRMLYRAAAELFLLVIAENRYSDISNGYKPQQLEESFRRLFELCASGFRQRIAQLAPHAEGGLIRRRLMELIDFIHKHAFRSGDAAIRWLDIYRHLLWQLADQPELLKLEADWLDAEEGQATPDSDKHKRLRLARLHLEMLHDHGKAFPKLLELAQEIGEIDHCFAYVEASIKARDWLTVQDQLSSMMEAVRASGSKQAMSRYLNCWLKLMPHLGNSVERAEALKALLPHSFELYAGSLEQMGDYRAWIDLQIAADRPLQDMSGALLQRIEQQDPQALLPLYHQLVERSIAERRRDGYKQAAELLRRLQACYERLQQSDRFEEYLMRLTDKYKMLRAFHEELRRSHLNP
jgi:uncharacterized Zn finger protein